MNDRTRFTTRIVAIVALASCPASAADLDAPAAEPVTIRSEIKRGHGAVYHLLDQAPEILSFIKACDALRARNEEQRRSSAAFKLGTEAAEAAIMRNVFEKSKSATTRNLATVRAKIHSMLAEAYQKQLGLTEIQMQELIGSDYFKTRDTGKKPSAEITAGPSKKK